MKKLNIDDYIGQRFGKLIVTGYGGMSKLGTMATIICDCGNTNMFALKNIKSGRIKSCGCNFHMGAKTHGLRFHPLYHIWANIKDRCINKNCDQFKHYGGRGVIMCKEWSDNFKTFYDWAITKWEKGLQIDKDILYKKKYRTNLGLIYSPEFCCFVTTKVNCNNKSNNRILCVDGIEMTTTQATEMYNIPESTLNNRLNRGWSDTKAATTPRMTQFSKYKTNNNA